MRKQREKFLRRMTSGHIDWSSMFSRYVWDDEKTPYLTPVRRLTVSQVSSEVTVFALAMGVVAVVMSVAYLSGKMGGGDSFAVALYCFIVACACLILGVMRPEPAAWIVASFPFIGALRLAMGGFSPSHGVVDRLFMITVCLILLYYSWRIIRITRHEPLPDKKPDS